MLAARALPSLARSVRPSTVRLVHSSPVAKADAPSAPAQAPTDDAHARAMTWLNAVPGSDKAYNFVIGTSALAVLIGKEIIPYTAEFVYTIPFTASIMLLYKHAGPALRSVANSVHEEEAKFFFDSKKKAEAALNEEIQKVTGSGVTDLVDVTRDLFDHAREVVKLEAQAYEHEQNLAFYGKAKQILDDWVKYEAAVRDREQKRIAEQVTTRVMASIKDQKFQDRYLDQCIADVEAAVRAA